MGSFRGIKGEEIKHPPKSCFTVVSRLISGLMPEGAWECSPHVVEKLYAIRVFLT